MLSTQYCHAVSLPLYKITYILININKKTKQRKTKTYKWYSSSVKNARRNSRHKKRFSSKIYK